MNAPDKQANSNNIPNLTLTTEFFILNTPPVPVTLINATDGDINPTHIENKNFSQKQLVETKEILFTK